MTKKHFIALADELKDLEPQGKDYSNGDEFRGAYNTWKQCCYAIAGFCRSQNSNFNRERWFSYIAGECGPNGGKVKAKAEVRKV